MAKQLLGKEVTDALNAKLIERANALKEKGVVPTLGIVRVGENPSDLSYEKGATKRAELIGINVQKFVLPEDASKEDLLKLIDEINANDAIHGVLMFRPLPKHLKADQNEICNRLDPKKDVDCMTDLSNAGVFEGRSDLGFAPCTPARLHGDPGLLRHRLQGQKRRRHRAQPRRRQACRDDAHGQECHCDRLPHQDRQHR